MSAEHARLLRIVTKLPTDYTPWGSVERWEDPSEVDGDCSSGCRHARPLDGHLGADWVVCTREGAPRAGLLTFATLTERAEAVRARLREMGDG